MEYKTFIETFFNWYDASTWLSHHIDEVDLDDWVIEQASINYINNAWRAGFSVSKRQTEMQLDS